LPGVVGDRWIPGDPPLNWKKVHAHGGSPYRRQLDNRAQTPARAHRIPVGTVDGSFGPATESGVRAFQTRVGLIADGIVDPRTLARLLA
jgi:peptidoglycan hydrolase-like protein with peptidoglycan-binding domain